MQFLRVNLEREKSITHNENECEYEEENEEDIPTLMTFVEHETKPFTDAEYIIQPSEVIPDDQPLPKDLQELADRCKELNPEQKKALESLLKHSDVFAKDNTTFGKCPWLKFRIDTGDHPPIKQNARPVPIHYREAVRETFFKYLQQGAIVPSQSAWSSPILCVFKKKGEVRDCIDYRALNAITRILATPIPRVHDLLQHMGGKKLYHLIWLMAIIT
ncbi:hypothetical protein ONE63_004550 [Megalurothrips usitatus]|uniref:Reverse transcriptase n=1 Tax=Megalurothrips usitatus TaxID=439358 RepID=A0AAV7X6N4_9NEOP|nr:hypothetical protein ONE63_004550 [Megalurothrips usitatus]